MNYEKGLETVPVKLMGVCATMFPVGSPARMTLLGSKDSHVYGLPAIAFDRCSTSEKSVFII